MAFSNYQEISQVQRDYQIRYTKATFVVPTALSPSANFLSELQFTTQNMDVFNSEGSRTEFIISPILREVYKNHAKQFSFWAQKAISADPILSGTPDYIFGTKSPLGITVLETPLVLIVEAKKNDFELGWGQCLAELVAAQKINGDPSRPVYGIVTDGLRWDFGKLTADVFTEDTGGYVFAKLQELFGAIDFVLQSAQLLASNALPS